METSIVLALLCLMSVVGSLHVAWVVPILLTQSSFSYHILKHTNTHTCIQIVKRKQTYMYESMCLPINLSGHAHTTINLGLRFYLSKHEHSHAIKHAFTQFSKYPRKHICGYLLSTLTLTSTRICGSVGNTPVFAFMNMHHIII